MIFQPRHTLDGEEAVKAALRFEGVGLLFDGEPITNKAAMEILPRLRRSSDQSKLTATVSHEIYLRMRPRPLHVHCGEPARERSGWQAEWRKL